MPGRFRTGSRPSSTVMSRAPYEGIGCAKDASLSAGGMQGDSGENRRSAARITMASVYQRGEQIPVLTGMFRAPFRGPIHTRFRPRRESFSEGATRTSIEATGGPPTTSASRAR